jgi:hypothetical protein
VTGVTPLPSAAGHPWHPSTGMEWRRQAKRSEKKMNKKTNFLEKRTSPNIFHKRIRRTRKTKRKAAGHTIHIHLCLPFGQRGYKNKKPKLVPKLTATAIFGIFPIYHREKKRLDDAIFGYA